MTLCFYCKTRCRLLQCIYGVHWPQYNADYEVSLLTHFSCFERRSEETKNNEMQRLNTIELLHSLCSILLTSLWEWDEPAMCQRYYMADSGALSFGQSLVGQDEKSKLAVINLAYWSRLSKPIGIYWVILCYINSYQSAKTNNCSSENWQKLPASFLGGLNRTFSVFGGGPQLGSANGNIRSYIKANSFLQVPLTRHLSKMYLKFDFHFIKTI